MGMNEMHHMMPQEGEWDVDLVNDEPEDGRAIVGNKWVKLAILPVHFVLLLALGIAATMVCSLVISPIFVMWKCWDAFSKICRDVVGGFANK